MALSELSSRRAGEKKMTLPDPERGPELGLPVNLDTATRPNLCLQGTG